MFFGASDKMFFFIFNRQTKVFDVENRTGGCLRRSERQEPKSSCTLGQFLQAECLSKKEMGMDNRPYMTRKGSGARSCRSKK